MQHTWKIQHPLRAAALLLVAASTANAGVTPQFLLYDTTGAAHRESEWSQARAVLLFFITTDCPLSNGYIPEMNRIAKAYLIRGVRTYAVLGDSTVPHDAAVRHAREFGLAFPLLFDPQQALAAYTGATVTPEAALLSPHGELLYLGRVDNSVERLGIARYKATIFDLREALAAILSGRPAPHPRTAAFGCAITRLP